MKSMKRTEAVSIGEVIMNVVKQNNLEERLLEQRIIDSWHLVVGPTINKYTVNRYISNHTLYVYLTSAAVKSELMLHKSSLLKRLNEITGKETITDVVIR
ncbi:MAG: DUF721 domain-containing protein [Muribaculaceae bacterium]|nr:DUF721 domain-containing protein [Muribaculaceae bacterium]